MSEKKVEPTKPVHFLDLPSYDVIQSSILPLLSWKDLLRFRRVSKQCYQMASEYFSRLRNINFSSESENLTTEDFEAVTDGNDKIQVLNLSHCRWVNEDSIIRVLQLNPNIENINLVRCQTTRACIAAIAKSCNGVQILEFERCLMNCRQLAALATACKNLTSINLTGCNLVKDLGVVRLAENCIMLTSINISMIYDVSDVGLTAIAENCKKLMSLDITGCFSITDKGIEAIGINCLELKYFRFCITMKVTRSSLKIFENRNVNVVNPELGIVLITPQF